MGSQYGFNSLYMQTTFLRILIWVATKLQAKHNGSHQNKRRFEVIVVCGKKRTTRTVMSTQGLQVGNYYVYLAGSGIK